MKIKYKVCRKYISKQRRALILKLIVAQPIKYIPLLKPNLLYRVHKSQSITTLTKRKFPVYIENQIHVNQLYSVTIPTEPL
jgi:hypothetical protein